jgi:hypothetical protein
VGQVDSAPVDVLDRSPELPVVVRLPVLIVGSALLAVDQLRPVVPPLLRLFGLV